jgi:RNA-binding protein YhbY
MVPLTNTQVRDLKAQAQKLKAALTIGKEGLSPQFLVALDEVLKHHELVKVKVRRVQGAEEGTGSTARRKEQQPSGHPGWQCGYALPPEASGGRSRIVITSGAVLDAKAR